MDTIIAGLVYNIASLLVLDIIYNMFLMQLQKLARWRGILSGFIIGIIGIILMLTPVKLIPGIFFDTRTILISVTAMFFGYVPTAIAAVIICAARIIMGGSGTLMGILTTLSASGIGLLWYQFRLKKIIDPDNSAVIRKRLVYAEFYLVGVAVHIAMLLCIITLPGEIRLRALTYMGLPVLLLYPVGSLVLSSFLFGELINNRTRLELITSENRFKELYHENEKKQTLLRALVDSIPDLIFYKDTNSVYMGCNVAFEKFAGRNQKELIGLTDWDLFDSDMADMFLKMDNEMLKQGKSRRNDEVVTYPDGRQLYYDTLKTPYFDSYGKILGLIGISRDITERKKKEEEILYLTYHDSLTGLYNRTFFDEEIHRIDNVDQLPVSVIIGDVNGLKIINDAFGHDEGDKLLCEIAKIISSCLRPGDIAARIGGDEFGILLPKTDSQTVQSVVKQIQNLCDQYINKADKETYYVSIALGPGTKTKSSEPLDKVRNSAEEFMYKRKLLEHKSPHSSILASIKTTMHEKSHETQEHTDRLGILSKKLGSLLNLDEREMVELELLCALHDIGKIGVDERVLTKTAQLTDDEWREMKKHPEIGYRIAMATPEFRGIAEYILCHHERWDGKGYPQGISGEEIPVLSRIISIADAYDAMTNDRIYRKALSKEEAKNEIIKNAGTQFDPLFAGIFAEKVLD